MSEPRILVRVTEVRREAEDVASFSLEAVTGQLPPVLPGAHIDVFIAPGVTRQYSICNGPEPASNYVIAVKREVPGRGGSAAMHSLAAGAALAIGAPRNNFPLARGAARHVLLAGGIGITPLLSMARHLASAREPFELHYFARSPAHTAFTGALAELARAGRVALHHGLDPAATGAALAASLRAPSPDAHAYLCGPTPFIALAQERAVDLGWPAGQVHVEHFGAVPAPASAGEMPFRVVLARSGRTIEVGPGETILDSLRREAVEVEVSCEQGICGTCVTCVLDGSPDHRDSFLTDEERAAGNKMCVCVSRATSERLTLDL